MHYFTKSFCAVALLLLLSFSVQAQNFNFQLRASITFPGQTLANICGWTSPDGKEYALVGASKGLVIVDITNPDAPVQIVQIPGPDNLWKEIKTYRHYAYVTSEGGGGVQIVDLSGLPSANLQYHSYIGNGDIPSELTNIHALHIDTTSGFLYTYGGNLNSAAVHDLKADPYNPTYAGRFNDLGYIHDGYAENDTLYACHIYTGLLSIVDMKDKQNPVVLGTVQTPGKFTHNSWLLADHNYILTTDEALPSFVTAYDISDPSDIVELDRFSIDNGEGSIGHNVQVINDWTVTSWYTGGVVITDCHRPQNLVKTAQYDTWAGSGPDFDGCWGAFPYFPSGTVIASNIEPGQLFILTPTYQRACYLEGTVRNGCDGTPLSGVTVEILNGEPGSTEVSDNNGIVKTGQATSGNFTIRLSKAGYVTQTFDAVLAPGEVSTFDITLAPASVFMVSGAIQNEQNQPLANYTIQFNGNGTTYSVTSDNNGMFNLDCIIGGNYVVSAGVWGNVFNQEITINSNSSISIVLEKKYYDNFSADYGWVSANTSLTGIWTLGEPVGTEFGNSQSNPDEDVTFDTGDQCYVTGNNGGSAGSDDVDDGFVTLTCPAMKLNGFSDAILTFSYWFLNDGGSGDPNDIFEVSVSNGIANSVVFTTAVSESAWKNSGEIHLSNFIALNDNVTVTFYAADDLPGHLVEAAVDVFSVTPVAVSNVELVENGQLSISPNPSSSDFVLQYDLDGAEHPVLEVRNAIGQLVVSHVLSGGKGSSRFGADLIPGFYTAQIKDSDSAIATVKLVKSNK